LKIKGESMDWNSRVFSLLLKTDKSMINAAVELSFRQIHAKHDRKGTLTSCRYISQLQGIFLVAPTSRMAVATNSETTNPLASILVLEI
jgi:hypothetical protein